MCMYICGWREASLSHSRLAMDFNNLFQPYVPDPSSSHQKTMAELKTSQNCLRTLAGRLIRANEELAETRAVLSETRAILLITRAKLDAIPGQQQQQLSKGVTTRSMSKK